MSDNVNHLPNQNLVEYILLHPFNSLTAWDKDNINWILIQMNFT